MAVAYSKNKLSLFSSNKAKGCEPDFLLFYLLILLILYLLPNVCYRQTLQGIQM